MPEASHCWITSLRDLTGPSEPFSWHQHLRQSCKTEQPKHRDILTCIHIFVCIYVYTLQMLITILNTYHYSTYNMYVCMCVCTKYVCLYACIHLQIYINMYTCIHIYIYTYPNLCIYTFVNRIFEYIFIYIYIYINAYT